MSQTEVTLPMQSAKRRLMTLWLVLGLFLLLALLWRTMGPNAYGDETSTVWTWFLPNIVPTLMLMIGISVADDIKRRERERSGEEDKPETGSVFLYRVALGLSLVHLLLLLALIVYEALPSVGSMPELIKKMGYFTAISQGLCAAVLGAFFSKS